MELIKQRNEHDCGIAVLAMVLSARADLAMSFDEIEEALGHKAGQKVGNSAMGVTDVEIAAFLFEFGEKPVMLFTKESLEQFLPEDAAALVKHRYVLNSGRVKEILWDRQAILVVESQNQKDAHHYIVWDRDRILDPANQNVYRDLGEIATIHTAILLD